MRNQITIQNTVATLALLFVFALPSTTKAQKFAYIDTDYVLLHLPDFAAAQQELNTYAIDWQAEIESKLDAADRLEVAYRAERVLLTKEMRQKREQEISSKRSEAKEMQKQKFGVEGELFQKRQELIEPIQQQIFEELKDIASSSGYMVIFDKSNQSNMLYTNPKYDISDRLIKKLGYVPGETIEVEERDDAGRDAGNRGVVNSGGGRNGGRGGNTVPSNGRGGSTGLQRPGGGGVK